MIFNPFRPTALLLLLGSLGNCPPQLIGDGSIGGIVGISGSYPFSPGGPVGILITCFLKGRKHEQ